MVTIEEREEELKQIESQAQQVANRPIPQRRFGAGVTPAQQRQAVASRQQAQQVLQEVSKEREELRKAREARAAPERRRQLITQAIKDALRGKVASSDAYKSLSSEDRQLVKKETERIEERFEKQTVNREVARIETQLGEKLTPEKRQQIAEAVGESLRGNIDSARGRLESAFGSSQTTGEDPNQLQPTERERFENRSIADPEERVRPITPIEYGLRAVQVQQDLQEEREQSRRDILVKGVGVLANPSSFGTLTTEERIAATEAALFPIDVVASIGQNIGDAGIGAQKFFSTLSTSTSQQRTSGQFYRNLYEDEDVKDFVYYGLPFAAAPVAAAFPLSALAFDVGVTGYTGYKFVQEPSIQSASAFGLNLVGAGFGGFQLSKQLREEVVVAVEPSKKIKLGTQANIANIQQGEESFSLAQFNIKGYKEPRYAVVTSRFNIAKVQTGLVKIKLPEQPTLEDYAFAYGGRVVEVERATASISQTENFLIKEGEIMGSALRPGSLAAVGTQRGSPARQSPLQIGALEGYTKPEAQELARVNRKKLDINTRAALDILENQQTKTGELTTDLFLSDAMGNALPAFKKKFKLEASDLLPKGTKLDEGEVILTDVLDIPKGKKEFKNQVRTDLINEDFISTEVIQRSGYGNVVPQGSRVTRGQVTAVSNTQFRIDIEAGEFGIRGYEKSIERIGVTDITFPTNRVNKKVSQLQGISNIFEINLPEAEPLVVPTVKRGVKPVRTEEQRQALQQSFSDNKQVIQKAQGVVSLKTKASLKSRPTRNVTPVTQALDFQRIQRLPSIVGGSGKAESQYSGTGQYEFTTVTQFYTPEKTSSGQPTKEITIERTSLKEESRLEERGVEKSLFRVISNTVAREDTSEKLREEQRLQLKTLIREVPKNPSKTPARNPPIYRPTRPRPGRGTLPKIVGFRGKKGSNIGNELQLYRTFVVRGGNRRYLPGLRTKGRALERGQDVTLKTLGAQFGIEPTRATSRGRDKPFKASTALRDYRIKGGKRISLDNIYIQRTRKEGGLKGGRLASTGEVAEILSTRRRKR